MPVRRFRLGDIAFFAPGQQLDTVEHVIAGDEYSIVPLLLAGHGQPTVIDAGAHIGTFSIHVLRHFPAAVVHSVEPNPLAYPVLDRNRRANPLLHWHTYEAAVWSSSGRIGFQTDSRLSTRSAVAPEAAQTVRSMGLGDLLSCVGGRVDLLKMDVEGAEEAALTSAEHLLSAVSHLIVQIHPDHIDTVTVEALLGRAFAHVHVLPGERRNPLLLASHTARDLPLGLR